MTPLSQFYFQMAKTWKELAKIWSNFFSVLKWQVKTNHPSVNQTIVFVLESEIPSRRCVYINKKDPR